MLAVEKFREERRAYIKSLRLVSAYSLAANMCMLALPLFMLNTYRTVIPSQNIASLVGLFLFAAVLLAAMGVFDAARQIMLARAAARFESQMAGYIFTGELNRQHDPSPSSMQQLAQLKTVMTSPALTAIFDLPMFPVFTLLIFLIHPLLGLTLLFAAGVLIALAVWADRRTAPYMERTQSRMQASAAALAQQFTMQEYVRSQGLFREALQSWGASQRELLEDNLHLANRTAVHGGISKAVRQFVQISLIAVGALLVLSGGGDIIMIIAASIIGGKALQPLDMLIGSWRNLRQGYITYNTLRNRLEELNVPDAVTPLPPPKGDVAVTRMSYVAQPGQAPILRGIQFGVAAGEMLAILGPSGAGKSTLAKLLVGIYEPTVGNVTLDGQAIAVWDPVARGHHIGYIPQSVEFFQGTVQQNIASMRHDDPKEWAVHAAQRAGVHDMIMAMPQGYDTVMKKGAFWPSGGQAQLLALARAFYGNPRLLVLDEPNSALDQVGEQIFHRALDTAKKAGITTMVITQRPAVIHFADKVLVVKAGQIDDFGPRDKVMQGNKVRAVSSKSAASGEAQAEKAAQGEAAETPADAKPGKKGVAS